ncbi:hypothetical protein HQ520_16615, partial [bacterium]|nr:hypothetical protein [bacterium]
IAEGKAALIEKTWTLGPAQNPAILTCALRQGPAHFINLAPGPDDSFALIDLPVTVREDTRHEKMRGSIRGWIQPQIPVAQALEEYSRWGGTHHSALLLGRHAEGLAAFADFGGVEFTRIEGKS